MEKKRVIKSLENLDADLKGLLKREYPDGYENDLIRLTNANKQPFFVVRLETPDTMYLVKVAVIKNSDGGYDLVDDDDDDGDDDDRDLSEDYDPDFDS